MIFFLILYSHSHEYNEMYKLQSQYLKNIQIPHLFYCFNEEQENEYSVIDDILYIRGKETYIPGILDKTIKAIKYVKDNYSDIDYIVRQNISTIILYPELINRIIESDIDFGGPLLYYAYPNTESGLIGNKYDLYGHLPFISGICMIFSRKAIEFILAHIPEIMEYELVDDLSISYAFSLILNEMIFETINGNIGWNTDYNNDNNNDIICYRNKSNDRSIDIERMKNIIFNIENNIC